MNEVNFLGQPSFPWSSDTFDFLQKMTLSLHDLARIGGDTYILFGCEDAGINVAPGVLVIKGEVLPFSGGNKQNTVYVKETRRDVDAQGYHFPEVYRSRSCEFGLGNEQYSWSDFKRPENNMQLSAKVAQMQADIQKLQGIPSGIITLWSGNPAQVPAGWALCDGHYEGDKQVPDLRGRFVVGFNPNDNDYNDVGKPNIEKKQVTLTENEIPAHAHTLRQYHESGQAAAGNDRYLWYNVAPDFQIVNPKDAIQDNTTTSYGKGQPFDIRPAYYVLAYIIKL